MDSEQQDEQFFQMLESAYDNLIENDTHPEESMKTPPDFDRAWSAIQLLPVNFPDIFPVRELAPAPEEPYTTISALGVIVSRSLQLSQRAMGLAINTAIFKARVGSLRRSGGSGSHAHEGEEEPPPANNSNKNDDGDGAGTHTTTGTSTVTALPAAAVDAPTEDLFAVDLESVSRLLADSYTDTHADVEVMLGCYRVIGKIAIGVGDGTIEEEGKEEEEEEEEDHK